MYTMYRNSLTLENNTQKRRWGRYFPLLGNIYFAKWRTNGGNYVKNGSNNEITTKCWYRSPYFSSAINVILNFEILLKN